MSEDSAQIRSIHEMAGNVKQFQLQLVDETWEFKSGQHTEIEFEQDGEEVERDYTPVTMPGTDTFVLTIKRYEEGTASVWMHDREVGDEIPVEEPHGNLYIRDYDNDVVLLSTGTGATPMFAMLKDYLAHGTGTAYYFHGEKDREHIFFQESLDQMESEHENLHVIYSLSDEHWHGPEGHIQSHLGDVLDTFADKMFYICGVPQMVVETEELLNDQGVHEDHIITEGWEQGEV